MIFIRRALIYFFPYVGVLLYSLFLLLIMEWIYRGSLGMVKSWIQTEYHEFIFVFVFISSINIMIYGFKRKIFLSILVVISFIFIILSIVNRVKLSLRGDPLIPADIILVSEAKSMLTYLSDIPIWQLITLSVGICLFIAAIAYTIYKLPKDKYWNWHRVVLSVSAAFLLTYIYYQEVEAKYSSIRAEYRIKTIDYNQKQNYELNGFLMAFIRNIKWLSVDPPTDYSKNTMTRLAKKYEKEPYEVTDEKPNIIMIMSESFWDPTALENVTYNQDPLQNFHEISKNQTSGSLLVPVFGGSTANTEFESLTGYSMNYLPAGSIPYLFYVKKPIQALPNILKEQGYSTTAIHSYHNWFYQRNIVYKNIGFDRFISLEYIPNPVVDFLYYRDKEVNDMIIEQMKQATEPNFIFAVTMQNHGPYKADMKKPYATVEVDQQEGEFSKEGENILEFFSDNMVQVDLELKRLIDELEKLDKKVMVVYYGDHLPLLGLNYQVYKEANYFEDEKAFEDYKKIYSTPLLIWDNFSNQKEDVQLSASYLPAYVLNRAGLEGTPLTNMLNSAILDGNSVFPRQDFIDDIGYDQSLIEEYEFLQYDALFGKRFDESAKVEANEEFRLGYQDPVITSIEVVEEDGKRVLVVNGDYLTKATKIFVNNEMIETLYVEGVLKATAPDIEQDMVIAVKVLDSYNRVLSVSNDKKLSNE